MRRNNDKMLLESLVRKYGKNAVKNAIRRINENLNSDFEIENGVLIKYHGNGGNVVIPQGVTKIARDVFRDCPSLKSVIIPDSVTSIGWRAFYMCKSLTSIIIPDSVTSIGDAVFEGCSSLKSVTIPDSVTNIGRCMFQECTSLTSVTIPDSVTEIGWYAFADCTSLTSVTIPDSITKIEEWAFNGCSSLTSITIPDSVTEIRRETFYNCTSLTSVTIGNGVTSIGERAFSDCKSLASINIPNGVKIGKDAFKGTKIEIKNKNKNLISDKIDDIVNAAIIVFSDWENDEDGWDEPFNAYKELSNNDFTDILDYYQGWDDFYNYLDMDEDEFNELYDKLSDRKLKMINKEIKDAF